MKSKIALTHTQLAGPALESILSLLAKLPGKRKHISKLCLQDLLSIQKLAADSALSDAVVVFDENWNTKNYSTVIGWLVDCEDLKNRPVYVISFGYQTLRMSENVWKLAYPWTMFHCFRKYKFLKYVPKAKQLAKGFGCLNNRPAEHRLMLGYQLYQQGVLDQVIFTQNIKKIESDFSATMFNDLPGIENYKALLPIPANHDLTGYVIDDSVSHTAYQETYCNIVTETYTELMPYTQEISYEFVSEKTAKPFLSGQIPLMLACPGHMTFMKQLGFEIMDQLTPLGYDQMRTLQKISAIVDVVKNGKDAIEEFYFAHQKEIQHNFEIAVTGMAEQSMINQIKSFV